MPRALACRTHATHQKGSVQRLDITFSIQCDTHDLLDRSVKGWWGQQSSLSRLIISTSFHKIQHPLSAPLIPFSNRIGFAHPKIHWSADRSALRGSSKISSGCLILEDKVSLSLSTSSLRLDSDLTGPTWSNRATIEKNIIPTFRHPQQVTFLRIQVSTHHWIKDLPAKT